MAKQPAITYSGPTISPTVDWETRRHLQLLYGKIANHVQGISLLSDKVNALKAGSSTTTIVGGVGGGGGGIATNTGVAVNNQSGQTSYSTLSGDNNALIVFSDASPIAVTLNTQTPPWSCFALNLGTSVVTFTPFSGNINGSSTFALTPNYLALIAFDSINWWASGVELSISDIAGLSAALALLAPLASPSLTGIPTAPTAAPGTNDTQIATTAYADAAVLVETTRAEATEALLAPIASPTFTGTVTQPTPGVLTAATTTTSATAGAATALPATPLGYLEMSVNGTTVKIPYYSV